MLRLILNFLRAIFGVKKPEPKPDPIPTPDPTPNQGPIAYPPFTVASDYSRGSRIDYDLRYREHGCDSSGHPTSVTGARDPDGHTLEYRITCKWSVYDMNKRRINGEWVTFEKSENTREQMALVTLFIGWESENPPYPFKKMCFADRLACQPNPQPEMFTYEVRDGRGGTASHTVVMGS